MAYEISGQIKKIFDTQTFPSGFTKREFVITTKDRFPQDIKLECLKEKTEILNGLSESDEVTVSFDVQGREYNERYFVNLNAWKIQKDSGSNSGKSDAAIPEDTTDYSVDSDDDIPF